MITEFIAPVGTGIYAINTGDWRTRRPVLNASKCNKCGRCFLYCPVFSIGKNEAGFFIDYSYCKGCGICAHECQRQAIALVPEGGGEHV